jgi:RNA polymerase sigma-70 factor (ECF subfamily)
VGATAFVSGASRPRAGEWLRTAPMTLDARIEAFIDEDYRRVVATVEMVCGSLATAEDAVQEGLARAWERERRGESIDNLAAWVTTVSLNLARSQMRRWRTERKVLSRLVPLQRELPDAPSASAEAYAVRQALSALPRRQREVTALRYYLGLDVAAIADWLGIGEGTVKAQLFRARQALAAVLGDEEQVDAGS